MEVVIRLYAENTNKIDQEFLDRINAELYGEYINPEDKTDVWEIFVLDGYTNNQIVFKTMYSYYGIGYERGDWVFISGLINILRQISGGKVYYYGDNQNEPDHEFTRVEQDILDKHWTINQNHPYRDFIKYKFEH